MIIVEEIVKTPNSTKLKFQRFKYFQTLIVKALNAITMSVLYSFFGLMS